MKTIDFTIDEQDLEILFRHTRHAYKGLSYGRWLVEIKKSYSVYFEEREKSMTFSQWVNGQIIALT